MIFDTLLALNIETAPLAVSAPQQCVGACACFHVPPKKRKIKRALPKKPDPVQSCVALPPVAADPLPLIPEPRPYYVNVEVPGPTVYEPVPYAVFIGDGGFSFGSVSVTAVNETVSVTELPPAPPKPEPHPWIPTPRNPPPGDYVPPVTHRAPELDSRSSGSMLTLLFGALAVIRARRRK